MSRVTTHISLPQAYAEELDREIMRRRGTALDRVSRCSLIREFVAVGLGLHNKPATVAPATAHKE